MEPLTLGYFLSPLFLLAAAGIGLNLVLSGVTGRCAVKSLLIRLGFPGERDLGRAEAQETLLRPRRTATLPRTVRPEVTAVSAPRWDSLEN